MTTLREFLSRDPLGTAESEFKRKRGELFFGNYFSSSTDALWSRVLSRFSDDIPFRYWDKQIIDTALSILERDSRRTYDALSCWKKRVGIGFDYLFRQASTEKYTGSFSITNATDLLLLANEFHPEYLRRCEYIFTNLILLYWSILKKNSVQGKFDISGATNIIRNKGYELLLSGYDEKVRNSIAHGQVIFNLFDIQYGESSFLYELPVEDFLFLFDTLWRTSNSLAIAILLFLARNHNSFPLANDVLPTGIISLIAASEIERVGLSIAGVIESEVRSGRQLHVLEKTVFKNSAAIYFECAHMALKLYDAGAVNYSRYVFEIDQGTSINSLLFIFPNKLAALQNESYEHISEIFDTPLIWTKESIFQNRISAFKIALLSQAKLGWIKFVEQQQSLGFFMTTGRYCIKKVENASAGGVVRIHIYMTLRFSSDANNREMLKKIILDVTKKYRRKLLSTNPSQLRKGQWRWYKRPKYIWVSLYQYDGPIRWATHGGWLGKNLITVAERIYSSKHQPIFVKKPDEIWKGICFQYSMDKEAVAKSTVEMFKLVHQINQDSANQKNESL